MKIKKLFAIMLSFVMTMSIMTFAAFAADPAQQTDPGNVTGQSVLEYGEGADINIVLTKLVASGHDVGLPDTDLEYTFEITQVSGDNYKVRDGAVGSSASYHVEPKPATGDSLGIAGEIKVKPTASNKLDATDYGYSETTDYYVLESENLLKEGYTLPDVAGGLNGDGQGDVAIYAYKVNEKVGVPFEGWTKDTNTTYHKPDPANTEEGTFNESLKLSEAEYVMYIYTKSNEEGTGRYIFAITCFQTVTNEGGSVTKVDKKNITKGGSTGIEGDWSEMEFRNDYSKTPVKDPDDPTGQPFQISKKVAGVDNDTEILANTKFNFDVTVTKSVSDTATKAVGRYWDSDDGETYYPIAFEGTGEEGVDYVTIQGGTFDGTKQKIEVFTYDGSSVKKTITLENNQKITFPEVAGGTTFKVEEHDYFTNAVTGTNGEYNLFPYINGSTTTTRPAATATDEEKKAAVDAARVITMVSSATTEVAANYVNDGSTGTTPTGIIMQYLPFFMIIALAIMALAVSVVVKGRRRARS